jgi:histidyl-tRNA synthetase
MPRETKFQAIKGVRDILPPETELWNRVEQTARNVFATYGFSEIRLPIFEQTELFARSIGGDTDVVSKEMYSFEDHESDAMSALRTLLVAKQPPISDSKFFLSYELKVAEFRERLRMAIESGAVTRTPENEKALTDMGTLLDRVVRDREGYERTNDAALFERFNLYVGIVRDRLLAVNLGDQVSLRPEATASVCRAYIEHGMQTLPQPVKLYYTGPMFRRERPQKGRYRQFYQIGAEVLGGSDAPVVDAEVIEMLLVFFSKAGLSDTTLYVNSIGCKDCRPKYVERLRAELTKVKDKLGADSQRRIETNPLRVLDSKIENEQAVIEKLPRIADCLCADCAKNYEEVKRELALRGIAYRENWRLVRGLDYYVRTTFEITAPGLGAQDAVCGGGRYDGLVELLGGPPTKGVGFAMGEDRLILSLSGAGNSLLATRHSPQVYIAWMGEAAYAAAVRAARTLRDAGVSVELPPHAQKFGKALGQADKLSARFALILGDDEVSSGQWTVKRLADGAQKKMSEKEFLAEVSLK